MTGIFSAVLSMISFTHNFTNRLINNLQCPCECLPLTEGMEQEVGPCTSLSYSLGLFSTTQSVSVTAGQLDLCFSPSPANPSPVPTVPAVCFLVPAQARDQQDFM
ncbi:hypothetical protein PGIGA_G00194920 [Pangasianodon gigas]|uniref:Uncharacterized protein n=1 Tax=Pangasianodon gigas TaxID=30993 RepID=A0ACC5XY50_PANGG|nr:hypothetical protein [Pangasianodon gigas]